MTLKRFTMMLNGEKINIITHAEFKTKSKPIDMIKNCSLEGKRSENDWRKTIEWGETILQMTLYFSEMTHEKVRNDPWESPKWPMRKSEMTPEKVRNDPWESPKWPLRKSEITPRNSEMTPRNSEMTQETPKWPQETLKWPQETTK